MTDSQGDANLYGFEELRKLRKHFPDLWEHLRWLDKQTWRTFLKNYSVEQLEARFAFEDELTAKGQPIQGRAFFDALRERLKEVS